MENIVQLAITMTEMDTGMRLSLEERKAMAKRILEGMVNLQYEKNV
jgi:hypothetical protein